MQAFAPHGVFGVRDGSLSGTLSARCPPLVFKREMEIPSPALPFRRYHFSLRNPIIHPLWLEGGVSGDSPPPLALHTSFPKACVAPGAARACVLAVPGVVSFQQGPGAARGLPMCGRNTVHGPFEAIFINIQLPPTQRATQQSSPSWSCMPIICRLKLLQCASPQWALPYLDWACGTIVVIIWGLRDFNKKL